MFNDRSPSLKGDSIPSPTGALESRSPHSSKSSSALRSSHGCSPVQPSCSEPRDPNRCGVSPYRLADSGESGMTSSSRAAITRYLTPIQSMYDVMRRIRASLDLPVVLNTAVTEMLSVLEADRVLISPVEPEFSELIIAEAVAHPMFSLKGQLKDPGFPSSAYIDYEQGCRLGIDDIYAGHLPPDDISYLESLNVRALLVIPIHVRGTLWGVMVAHQCSGPKRWSGYSSEVLETLMGELGVAIQHALYTRKMQQVCQRTQQLLDLQLVESMQRARRETALTTLSKKIWGGLSEKALVLHILELLTGELALTGCELAFVFQDPAIGHIQYTHPYKDSVASELPLEMSLQLQQNSVVCCTTDHPRHGVCTLMAYPLLDNGTLMGVLLLIRRVGTEFFPPELQFVEKVALQCIFGLRQARFQARQQYRSKDSAQNCMQKLSNHLRRHISNMMMAMRMVEQFGANERHRQHYLQIFLTECTQEMNLITKLSALETLEMGPPLVLSTLKFKEWVPEILRPIQLHYKSRHHQVEIQLSHELPATLSTDFGLLAKVMTELLTNAYQFTPPQQTIRFSMGVAGEDLRFQIQNTGVEIPEIHLPHVFNPFYRIPELEQFEDSGHGLGLTIVRTIVTLLEGTISLESQLQTTTVTVTIPMDLTPQSA